MSATKKIKAAIVGYGNIGRYAVEALLASPDFELVGVVRRDATNIPYELRPYRVVSSIGELGQVDVALLCTPTRLVEKTAREIWPKVFARLIVLIFTRILSLFVVRWVRWHGDMAWSL